MTTTDTLPRRVTTTAWRAPKRWWSDAFGLGALATLVVVVGMWLHNSGLQDLSVDPLISIGRLSGLLAADLMLVQVLMMARIPWLESVVGQDKLARWHRVAGFTGFDLLLVHILSVTPGYAGTDRRSALGEFVHLIVAYPGMLLALAAFGALVMVVVTSIRKARRRLRYESWHLLHLYAYLGVGLALPHQIWTGSDFIVSPMARAYWITLYVVTLAAVLIWRVALPVTRSARYGLRVARVVDEAPDVVSVHLRGRNLDRLPVTSGQFFLFRFLGSPGWTRAHPFSLSAAPHPDRMRVTVKALGDDSTLLHHLKPGSRVFVEGPYGTLTRAVRTQARVTMIASGVGITPLRALAEELPYAPGEVTLIHRVRDKSERLFTKELDWLSRVRGLQVVVLPGRRRRNGSWLPDITPPQSDAAALKSLVPHIAHTDVYICGPDEWATAVIAAAVGCGVPSARIHLERFTW
jgi:predicted ferric reductase